MSRLLAAVGAAARAAAPPVVAASSVGSWAWCPLKAWHATTLFNAGWLGGPALDGELLEGLAVLWAAELAKKTLPSVVAGVLAHGEPGPLPSEVARAGELARRLAGEGGGGVLASLLSSGALPCPGLICPGDFEEQLRRYAGAGDLLLYFRGEEWPLVARGAGGFFVIGVPDAVEEAPGGYRVVEVKSSGRPLLMARRRGRGYLAAKLQLAAYAWILSERWPVEEAVLVVKARDGSTVARLVFDPAGLAEWFEERGLPIAEALASRSPPAPGDRAPCGSCEYGGKYPGPGLAAPA